MNLVVQPQSVSTLPSLIDRASRALQSAMSSAEILEARDMASVAYDAAKKAARFAKAKGAHDDLIATAHRAQADALEIEAAAKRRLADEYDAAQERGEIQKHGGQGRDIPEGNIPATVEEVGLSSKLIHEARTIRDAEVAEPGIVRRALDEKLDAGEEPTKAALREVVTEAAMRGLRGAVGSGQRNPNYKAPTPEGAAWTHVYGQARAFEEWATPANIRLAILGVKQRADDQSDNIRVVRECAALFNNIVEVIDAQ